VAPAVAPHAAQHAAFEGQHCIAVFDASHPLPHLLVHPPPTTLAHHNVLSRRGGGGVGGGANQELGLEGGGGGKGPGGGALALERHLGQHLLNGVHVLGWEKGRVVGQGHRHR